MNRRPEWQPTIEEIRAYMRERWDEGVECPCCSQRVQLYRRRINRGMSEVLVAMARETIEKRVQLEHYPWIHVEHDLVEKGKAPRRARDFSLLRFWDLIEPNPATASGKSSGQWRLTPKGLWIVEHPRRELLAAFVEVFNDRKRGESKERISFATALRRPFDFELEVRSRAA